MIFFLVVVCSFFGGLIPAIILMGGSHSQEICDLRNKIASLEWEANWEKRKKKDGEKAVPPPPPINWEVSH